jgi:hypothetical protein
LKELLSKNAGKMCFVSHCAIFVGHARLDQSSAMTHAIRQGHFFSGEIAPVWNPEASENAIRRSFRPIEKVFP